MMALMFACCGPDCSIPHKECVQAVSDAGATLDMNGVEVQISVIFTD